MWTKLLSASPRGILYGLVLLCPIILFLLVARTVLALTNPTFVDSYLVRGGNETTPRYLAFNTDGTKMFVVGGTNDRMLEYALGTGFDFSTLSYSGNSERLILSINIILLQKRHLILATDTFFLIQFLLGLR